MSFDDIFDASFGRLQIEGDAGRDFFERFYGKFLSSSSEVRVLFRNTDMTAQKRMLKKSLFSLISFYASGAIDGVLHKTACRHGVKDLNISPHFYDLWLECLMETVKDCDPKFTDEVELAWRLILSPGIVYMKFGYDHF